MSVLSITGSVYSREIPVHGQRGYRFCQFSKEGTDMEYTVYYRTVYYSN